MRSIKISFTTIILLAISLQLSARGRTHINIPDIAGYLTLKCDLHMHTVFSDGNVWPIRVDEAWREGLDAIAITDHIEYLKYKDDIPKNLERPYEIAKDRAESLGIILIKGAEITRDMPPGHLNAIFLDDINKLDVKTWRDAIKAAIDQDAFVFWDDPGWRWRKPDETIWYDEHTEIYLNGWMHGLEIINGNSYYPLALTWGLEKDLSLLGNSDEHSLFSFVYPPQEGKHRTMTLIFAIHYNQHANICRKLVTC